MLSKLAGAKKAIAAAIGVALTGLTFAHKLTFLPVQYETLIGSLIAVLTPISVWLATNK